MTEYDSIMKDQIERRTVEVVNEETIASLITLLSDEASQPQG